MALALFSIYQDWGANYSSYYYSKDEKITPIFNIHFLTSLLFIASFGFIYTIHSNEKYQSPLKEKFKKIVSFLIEILTDNVIKKPLKKPKLIRLGQKIY